MGKLLPILLALGGLAAGIGAGAVMKPDAPAAVEGDGTAQALDEPTRPPPPPPPPPKDGEFVSISNQFVVPLLDDGQVTAMMILSLSVETAPGTTEIVYAREPKLRDAFLQVLFRHADLGGFSGNFLETGHLASLRNGLKRAAVETAGPDIRDVLIVDLVKQSL